MKTTGPAAGYSLIEVMIAMTMTLMIMAGVFSLMVQNQNVYSVETQKSDIQQALRVASDLLTRELRTAGRDPSGYAFDQAQQEDAARCPTRTVPPDTRWTTGLVTADAFTIRVRADMPTDEDGDSLLETALDVYSVPTDCSFFTPNPDPTTARGCDERGDSCINDPGEDVEFSFSPSARTLSRTLRIATTTATQPLADGFNSVTFAYFNAAGAEFTALPVAKSELPNVERVRVTLIARSEKQNPLTKDYTVYQMATDIELRNTGKKIKP